MLAHEAHNLPSGISLLTVLQSYSSATAATTSSIATTFFYYWTRIMVVTTIETRETAASDSSSDRRDYWCSRDAPQPLVSNDSRGSSPPAKATNGSPDIHYRNTPWPITSPVVKKVSRQSPPPVTGTVREHLRLFPPTLLYVAHLCACHYL